jgi:hypothetical protein
MAVKERLAAARLSVEAYEAERDAWKVDHDLAMECLDMEELATQGIGLFDKLMRLDTRHHRESLLGNIRFDAALDAELRDILRQWANVTKSIIDEIARFEAMGFRFDRANDLRRMHSEAISMLTPDAEFFGEELADLHDEAVEQFLHGEVEEMAI